MPIAIATMSAYELLFSGCGFSGEPERLAVMAHVLRMNDFPRWSDLAEAVDTSAWLGMEALSADEIAFLQEFAKRAPKRRQAL